MQKNTSKKTLSPAYQPKLLQHLINSSDSDSDVSLNDDAPFFQKQNNQDKKSIYSHQTRQSITLSANQNSKIKNNDKKSNQNEKQNASKTIKYPYNQKGLSSKPCNIKYESLKLSQYGTDKILKQQQLYEQNLKQYKHKFDPSIKIEKCNINTKNKDVLKEVNQNNQNLFNQVHQNDQYIDSLQRMRRSQFNSKMSIDNQQNSKIKISTHLKQNILQNQKLAQYEAQIQKLKAQLKRTKDIIKTLGLKNNDLQKSLQLKNTKIQQFESDFENSRITTNSQAKIKQSQSYMVESQIKNIVTDIYNNISTFMKQRVRQFAAEIMSIKMNPLLQQHLQNFLAQIIQINQLTVTKKLGIQTNISNSDGFNLIGGQFLRPRSLFNQNQYNQSLSPSNSVVNNRFKTSDTSPFITRQNAFLNNKQNPSKSKQNIAAKGREQQAFNKQNLTPNKSLIDNLTPNRKLKAQQEFKQLEKSLQKLREMDKQLQSTPLPKRTVDFKNNEYQTVNTKFNRNENSLVNHSHISANFDLDRSKSRRKKIFAETNQK